MKNAMDSISSDTIAALATPAGMSGVAIVRISGSDAYRIADSILGLSPPPSSRSERTFAYTTLISPRNGVVVDQVIALFFRAPKSYTCEDVIEIQGHGGRASAERLLICCLEAGARLAESGEFTKRAFLNGRIDLLQAESIGDLIRAESDRAAGAAIEQLKGSLSRTFNSIYSDIVSLHADATVLLDFSEDEVPQGILASLPLRIHEIAERAELLLEGWHEGHMLREGVDVVITGRPNVGKSSLLNALLGIDRAIVSHTPGTTRDTIEELLLLEGIPVRITDTAGLRDSVCPIESEGIERARRRMESAHINIHILEANSAVSADELDIISSLPEQSSMLFLNKSDLGCIYSPENNPFALPVIVGSLKERRGIKEIEKALKELICCTPGERMPHAVISERHRNILLSVLKNLRSAEVILTDSPDDLVLAADCLADSLSGVAEILGKNYTSDLLDKIFSGFCLGK